MRQHIMITRVLPALVALCLVHGCSARSDDSNSVVAVGLTSAEEARALVLFEDLGCPACHGDLGEGIEEVAPPLRDFAPYWTAERLSTYLLSPDYFRKQNPDFDGRRAIEYEIEMPSYEETSEEERMLLGRWLMTR